MEDERVRVLVVTYPAQGHINPSLQFARRLARMGVDVPLLTALSAINRITKTTTSSTPRGVTFLGFSDGYDDGLKVDTDFEVYMADLRRHGSEAIAKLVNSSGENGKPFVHVVYTILLSWVSQVTRALNVPSTFLWIQPAAILDIYYYSFYGYGDVIRNNVNDPSWSVELPGLPRLTGRDLPSFLCAPNQNKFALSLFKDHIDTLGEETNPKVLVNSFEALESEALRAIKNLNFVAVGPLIPSVFLHRKDPSDNSFGGDLLQKSNDHIEWLDSKPRGSVIYVAFGSISELAKQQTEEVARGLLDCERPFFWVMRGKGNDEKEEDKSVQILLVIFPAQGHINPSLQFAKRLVKMGVRVTFLTAFSVVNRITKSADAAPQGVTFLGFSDGYDDGFRAGMDFEVYMADLRRRGSEAVATAITSSADNGKPIGHVVYTTLLPWVSQATRDLHVPSTFLWIQPATILDIFYYSFYGYGDLLNESKISDPSWSIELPGLPRLTGRDLPSFLLAPNAYKFALPLFKEHIDTLDEETNPKILVNSFDALESEALRAIKKLNFVAIGPLIPSAFLDGKDPSDNSFGGDLLPKSNDYIEWLDSKPRGSVIYVAFGSISDLAKQQTEEIIPPSICSFVNKIMDESVQILLVIFPAQGQINPSLQFVKRLVKKGARVILLTAFSVVNRITKSVDPAPRGVTFLGFSDGYDDGFRAGMDFDVYMADLRRRGSQAVATAITSSADNGKPIGHVVYTTLLPWVSQATRDLHVPSTLLWIQPATILDIFYYSFYGCGDLLNESKISDPSWSIELPGLPRLSGLDLPSFLLAPNAFKFALPLFKEHIDTLDEETNPKILVNSFDALESEALQAIKKLNFVAIGPLIPSAFLDGKDPSDNSFGGDLLPKSNDYIEWLDSKPRGSVIYVAFGSISKLAKQQTEEVARGLLDCGRPFLWVMRGKGNDEKEEVVGSFVKLNSA
ncbi:hypothetical protein RHSIM_Rhsim02G0067100 [Rhododendron simsii]|uniref:Uncharacterized protein n=1 Tax=Rhododendron simsii TaxID=118357 RepID=A0A834HCR7_RHOSS|nr:hypothetical protein RHSIM_Rhsim02G0067100 [Rhododendron simsii]